MNSRSKPRICHLFSKLFFTERLEFPAASEFDCVYCTYAGSFITMVSSLIHQNCPFCFMFTLHYVGMVTRRHLPSRCHWVAIVLLRVMHVPWAWTTPAAVHGGSCGHRTPTSVGHVIVRVVVIPERPHTYHQISFIIYLLNFYC